MNDGSTYVKAMESINPESAQTPKDAVARVLAQRGQQPRVTDHLFRPGSAGHESQCGVGVPDVECGRIVGTTCGAREADHIQAEG